MSHTYPVIILPKGCTPLEFSLRENNEVLIDMTITCTVGGIIIYSGFCNVKLIDEGCRSNSICSSTVCTDSTLTADSPSFISEPSDEYLLFNQSEIWIDMEKSPDVYNDCQLAVCKDTYPPIQQPSQNRINIDQNGVVSVLKDRNLTINYEHKKFNKLPQSTKQNHVPVNESAYNSNNNPEDINVNWYQEEELECGMFLTQLPDEILHEQGNRERDVVDLDEERKAVKQFMAPELQSHSNQTRTIVFSGSGYDNGLTIQKMKIKDPNMSCIIYEYPEEIEYNSNSKKFQCEDCNQMFNTHAKFKEHILPMGKKPKKPPQRQSNRKAKGGMEPKYRCNQCNKNFPSQSKYDHHCAGHGDPDRECGICHKILASKFTLRSHRKIHERNKIHSCNDCPESFETIQLVREHSKIHSFSCDKCDFTTRSSTLLEEHVNKHNMELKAEKQKNLHFFAPIFDDVSNDETSNIIVEDNTLDKEMVEYLEEEFVYPDEFANDLVEEPYIEAQQTAGDKKIESGNFDKNETDLIAMAYDQAQAIENEMQAENNSFDEEETNLIQLVCDKGANLEQTFPFPDEQSNNAPSEFISYGLNFEDNFDIPEDTKDSDKDFNINDECPDSDDTVVSFVDEGICGSSEDKSLSSFEGQFLDNKSSSGHGSDNGSSASDKADSEIAKVMANEVFLMNCKKMKLREAKAYSKNCNVCDKKFDRFGDIKRHLIEHILRNMLLKNPISPEGKLSIRCEVCHQKSFSKIDHFKEHLRQHANLTTYKCSQCNKSFSDSSNFSKHKKVHGSSYLECDLCHRKFHSKKSMSLHLKYHSEHEPVQCDSCNKKFHFLSMLKKHKKSAHNKAMAPKYRCKFCFKYYASLKLKWEHEWKVHRARKYVYDCELCSDKFRKYSELKRHYSDLHGRDIPPASEWNDRFDKRPRLRRR